MCIHLSVVQYPFTKYVSRCFHHTTRERISPNLSEDFLCFLPSHTQPLGDFDSVERSHPNTRSRRTVRMCTACIFPLLPACLTPSCKQFHQPRITTPSISIIYRYNFDHAFGHTRFSGSCFLYFLSQYMLKNPALHSLSLLGLGLGRKSIAIVQIRSGILRGRRSAFHTSEFRRRISVHQCRSGLYICRYIVFYKRNTRQRAGQVQKLPSDSPHGFSHPMLRLSISFLTH